MDKNSNIGTIAVAFILCFLCSVVVSGATVGLRDKQEFNKQLDIKKNILLAAGLIEGKVDKEQILKAYERVKVELIDLDTGNIVEGVDPETFDQSQALLNAGTSSLIEPAKDTANIKRRENWSKVYKVLTASGDIDQIIFPVRGKGLWSTLYGFLAVSPDVSVAKGITFYQHGETPGLGGEIDNPAWQAQFEGKTLYSNDNQPLLRVAKGRVTDTDPAAAYSVDGLSGATITANGVTNMLRYWLGEQGFGPYIERIRRGGQQS